MPPELLDRFVGRYKSEELDHELPLIRQGNNLYIKENFWTKVELKPNSETQFSGDSKQVGKFNIKFFIDRNGNVDHFLAYLGFRGFTNGYLRYSTLIMLSSIKYDNYRFTMSSGFRTP